MNTKDAIHNHVIEEWKAVGADNLEHASIWQRTAHLSNLYDNLQVLASIPETRAILQSVLDSDLAKRVQALEAKIAEMEGDNR